MPKVMGTFAWECWLATPSFLSASVSARANQALILDENGGLRKWRSYLLLPIRRPLPPYLQPAGALPMYRSDYKGPAM